MSKCPVCRVGDLKEGTTTVTFEPQESVVVFKDVPARVCNNCGEGFIDSEIGVQLLAEAQDAAVTTLFEVRRFKVA